MRFGPQIQTVLPRERARLLASTARAAAAVEETAPSAVVAAVPTRAPKHHTGTALEEGHVAWLPRAFAHAT